MARRFSRNAQLYQPGTYGPFSINQFTQNDTTAIEWTMTVEGWPDTPDTVAEVTVTWGNGDFMTWHISGRQLNQDNTPRALVRERVTVPTEPDGQGGVRKTGQTTGAIGVRVIQPLRSAITVEAVA